MTRAFLPAALCALLTVGAPGQSPAQTAAGNGAGGAQVDPSLPADSSPLDPAQPPSAPPTDLAPPLDDAAPPSVNEDPATSSASQPSDTISNDPTIRQDNVGTDDMPSDGTTETTDRDRMTPEANQQFDPGFKLQADGDVGLTVDNITTGSVAAQAGLQKGDRIISIDGRTFTNANEFYTFAPQLTGRQIPIVIEREGQQQTISVFYPETTRRPSTFAEGRAWLGVYLQPDFSGSGALVSRVGRGSPAERAGVRPGDVVISLNGQDVYDFRGLVDHVGQLVPNSTAELVVSRSGQTLSINSSVGRLQTAAYRGPMTREYDRMPPPPTGNWSPSGYSSSDEDRLERLERLVEQLHADVMELRSQVANSR